MEFSYCVPGDEDMLVRPTDSSHTTLTPSYVFYNCTFVNNSATTAKAVQLATRYSTDHIGFGNGGGVAVFFLNGATGNTFRTSCTCSFEGNKAFFGGGMYVLFRNTSIGNTVTMNGSKF